MHTAPIVIVTPALADANNGNWQTARRWHAMLSRHHPVTLAAAWPQPVRLSTRRDEQANPPTLMIALHARRSAPSIAAWREQHPDAPLIVALTGTDLYRDIEHDASAQSSLQLGDALVVLNGKPHAVIDWKGAIGDALVLEMAVKATKQAPARHGLQPGTNELLLIPFHAERAQVDRLAKSLRAFASVQVLDGDEARWAFAKWQPPMRGPHNWTPAKAAKGSDPRWFMACFEGPAGKKGAAQASTDSTMELLCDGLSRGHVLVNGELVGAYDLEAGRDSVTLPAERLNESNELLIFDAEGRMPTGVRIRR